MWVGGEEKAEILLAFGLSFQPVNEDYYCIIQMDMDNCLSLFQ